MKRGLGAKFCRKGVQNRPKLKSRFQFPNISLTQPPDRQAEVGDRCGRPQGVQVSLAVLKAIFHFYLGPLSPGGSRGRVRTVPVLKQSEFWAGSGPEPGGPNISLILILA